MTGFRIDVRRAVRVLHREPGFALAAIGTLAIAIAVNAALFGFLNGIFFRPRPFPDADRLHSVRLGVRPGAEAPTVADVRAALGGAADLGVHAERRAVVRFGANDAGLEFVTGIEPALLETLPLVPIQGRLPVASEARTGAPAVALVAEDLAIASFGTAAQALGGTVAIDGIRHTIIGVLPARTGFPNFSRLWTPVDAGEEAAAGTAMLARLRPDTGPEAVRSRLLEALPGTTIGVVPLRPRAGGVFVLAMGSISFLLCLACANVGNLVLTRGTGRIRELAIRRALGASRAQLVRSALVEGAVLAATAAVIAGVASIWLTDVLLGLFPADQLPLWFEASPDRRVVAWITLAAGTAVLLTSGLPAAVLTRGGEIATDVVRVGQRLRGVLVATQLALATVLLAGAGLMSHALLSVHAFDPGFPAQEVVQLRAFVDGSMEATVAAVRALEQVPGARAVAVRRPAGPIHVTDGDRAADADVEAVSPTFFATVSLPLLAGRTFRTETEPDVIILSEALARSLYGSATDAVGRSLRVDGVRSAQVIGVAASRRAPVDGGLAGAAPVRLAYLPVAEGDPARPELLVRAGGDAAAVGSVASRALTAVPGITAMRPQTLAAAAFDGRAEIRIFASLFGGFGGLALLLAALGIYAVVAYAVVARAREIAVRLALGATHGEVVRHLLAGIGRAAAIGLLCGATAAAALAWALRAAFFGIAPGTPLPLVGVSLVFLATTMVSAWLPARRALRIAPAAVLRDR